MSNVSVLIDIFRMDEISKKTRAKLIITMGNALNATMGMNLTEELVFELVQILEPENEIINSSHYLVRVYGFTEIEKVLGNIFFNTIGA